MPILTLAQGGEQWTYTTGGATASPWWYYTEWAWELDVPSSGTDTEWGAYCQTKWPLAAPVWDGSQSFALLSGAGGVCVYRDSGPAGPPGPGWQWPNTSVYWCGDGNRGLLALTWHTPTIARTILSARTRRYGVDTIVYMQTKRVNAGSFGNEVVEAAIRIGPKRIECVVYAPLMQENLRFRLYELTHPASNFSNGIVSVQQTVDLGSWSYGTGRVVLQQQVPKIEVRGRLPSILIRPAALADSTTRMRAALPAWTAPAALLGTRMRAALPPWPAPAALATGRPPPSLAVVLGGALLPHSRLTGPLTIDAEAGVARLVEFAYLPPNPAAPGRVLGAALAIADGEVPLFAGRVERADRNPATGVISVRATDRLQEHAANLSESAILAAVPGGRYSRPLHGDRASGWEQLQDVVSTTLGDYDLDPTGAGRYTPWTTSGAPAVVYSTYVDGTLTEHRPDLSALTNRVLIDLGVRYVRRWHRELACSWSHAGTHATTWCEWFLNPYTVPERPAVEAAAAGGGHWSIKRRLDVLSSASQQRGISTTGHPESAHNICGDGAGWVLNAFGKMQVLTAAWTMVCRYVQWIREQFSVTVAVSGADPVTTAEASYAIDSEAGADGWDSSPDTSVPSGTSGYSAGAYRWDARDDDEVANGLHAAIGMAARDIVAAHREWELSFEEPIDPARDLGERVRLACADGDWSGQVSRVEHVYDLIAGRAVTRLTLALGGGTLPPYSLPAAPTTITGYSEVPVTVSFPTHIGSSATAAEYDEDWLGWTGNYNFPVGIPSAAQVYPEQFRVEYPEIPADHREERTYTADPITIAVTVISPE